jgi:alpha-tubulin suppressor-like RCC1 family protein
VAAIGAGFDHTLFVKTDGTVYATGLNSNGQLGDASTTQRTSPVQMSGVSTAVAAAGGDRHSIILLSDGTLAATGYNGQGQLADGTTTQRTSPVAVSSLTGVTAIAVGSDHALARKSDGTVWAWGANASGQVGDGSTTARTTPVEIGLSSIPKIGAGHNHSLAASSAGVVWTWGMNNHYQLGDGTQVSRATPDAISGEDYDWKVSTPTLDVASGTYTTDRTVVIAAATSGATIRYTQNGEEPTESDPTIASGSSVSVTVSQVLKAKAWKAGMPPSSTATATYTMQVGQPSLSPSGGTYTSAQTVSMSTVTPGATLRYTTDGTTPTESSAAYTGAINVGTTTTIKVLGFKAGWTASTLRTGTFTMNFGTLSAPTADPGTGAYIDSVTVTLAAMSGAEIRYSTNNTAPQSNSPLYTAPLVFETTTTLRAKAFHPDYTPSAETSRTYTLAAAAPIFSPTGGTYVAGQLVTLTSPSSGTTMRYTLNGADPTTSDPAILSGSTLVVGNYTLKARAWKTGANASAVTGATYTITGEVTPPALAAGKEHSVALRHDSVAWAWGRNSSGEVGDGTTTSPRLLPKIVTGLVGAAAVTAGGGHSLAVMADGAVVGWGLNASGRVGDGTTTNRLMPVPITALAGMIALAAGDDHTLGLHGDGSVYAWGGNSESQLGDGGTTARHTPDEVSGVPAASAVATGFRFSLALAQDGAVWAWGRNANGQIGNGSTTTATTPVTVSGLTTATAIAAGNHHALALLADGTVVAWGRNTEGALGDGTTTDRTTPVAVAGLSSIVAIAAAGAASFALDDEGVLWAWGANSFGELADGTTTNRSSAAAVTGLGDIVRVAAGGGHVLALQSDGTVWAWGRNDQGQIGDGTTTNRLTPVAISGPGLSWRVATPALSLASGLYTTEQSVTVTIADPDATLRYTTSGADPTATDPTVTSGGSIPVNESLTLKVSGWKTGAPTSVVVARAYELKAVAPALTPGAGAYGSPPSVAISTTTTGASIRYTTDGAEPTPASALYSTPVTVAETQTVKARAYRTGWTPSDAGYASYWVSAGTVATPVITPEAGAYEAPPLVTIATATEDATLRYTLDGTTPTAASPLYRHPFVVVATTTVQAVASKAGLTPSAVATATFEVDATGATATPLIVPAGGGFATARTVTITGPEGATLRYTTDGADPTTASAAITSGGTLNVDRSQVVKVRAWATGLEPSAVRRADFVITGALAAGELHSVALTAGGVVWAWGQNATGAVGDGSTAIRLAPVSVLSGAAAVAAGQSHTLAAKADGTLWAWGTGGDGRLGTGTTGNRLTPTEVSGLTNVVAVAAGDRHSLALKADGTVWGFGHNADGAVGDGTTTNRTTPVQVVGLSGVVAIAAGNGTSYALQADGAGTGLVWAWGLNTFSQLGDGATLARTTPVRVTGLSAALAIAAMAESAAAIGADGQIHTWGRGESGQLGTGATATAGSAQPVPPIAGARIMAAGTAHALVLDRTTRLWAWGLNAHGQLGFGSHSNTPSMVPERSDLSGALHVAAHAAHSLAARPDGSVVAIGANGGRLGDGGTATQYTPVAVSGLTLSDTGWLTSDADGDGLPAWREYFLGTDPLEADTNGDGVGDGVSEASGLDPADPDVDGDGVPNWVERAQGTDPFRADTDGDGHDDGVDAFPLDSSRWDPPLLGGGDTTPPVITLKEPVSACPVPCSPQD